MYRTIQDFLDDWKSESEATQKLLDALTDSSLSQQVVDGHRTVARVAWHIVTTIPEMMPKTGLTVKAVVPEAPVPARAEEIQKAYRAVARELLEQIQAKWKDQTLTVVDDMYGEKWPRGRSARILIDHQIHHRGQLTVLMRQAGLKIPGIYGPSKEEWSQYGAPAPEI